MPTNYVFSTLATDMTYTHWVVPGDGIPPVEARSIFVQGGTGVAQKAKHGSDIWTPLGRVTEVSDEDLALLEQNQVFQLHKKNNFITVQRKKAEAEKVASDMSRSDPSSPKTEADYPPESGLIVTTDVPKSTLRPGA